MLKKKRDDSFDFLKGICILLMILGHSKPSISLYCFIYSFHMPVFFLLPVTLQKKNFVDELVVDSRRLLIPYLATCLIVSILCNFVGDAAIIQLHDHAKHVGVRDVLTVFRPVLFLVALFWSRQILNICTCIKNDILMLLICFFISVVAINFSVYVHLPLALLPAMASLCFLAVGFVCKKKSIATK